VLDRQYCKSYLLSFITNPERAKYRINFINDSKNQWTRLIYTFKTTRYYVVADSELELHNIMFKQIGFSNYFNCRELFPQLVCYSFSNTNVYFTILLVQI